MEESFNSLDGWVAFKTNPFKKDVLTSHRDIVLVAWNVEEQVFAVTVATSHRKASDRLSDSQATCIRYAIAFPLPD